MKAFNMVHQGAIPKYWPTTNSYGQKACNLNAVRKHIAQQSIQLKTNRDAKSEEHEEHAPAIFPPAELIFGLPTQKIC